MDVTVEELRNRLRQGNIYKPEKVEQALSNFFRKGNLSTLRELALRAVADEVGEKAASYRTREGLEPALIPERVMVCMSSNAAAPARPPHRRAHRRTAGREVVRRLRRDAAGAARQDQARRLRCAEAEHPARREPGRDGRPRESREAGRRPHRVRPARRHHARHLRPERADAGRGPDEGIDAEPVSRGSERRRYSGRSARRYRRTDVEQVAGSSICCWSKG